MKNFELIVFIGLLLQMGISFKLNQTLWKNAAALFEKSSLSAEVRSQCMIREAFYYTQPGVAQVLNGELDLYGVMVDILHIPIDQIKVKKIRKNCFMRNCGFRRFTVFYLDFPHKANLRFGIESKDSAPWERILKLTE